MSEHQPITVKRYSGRILTEFDVCRICDVQWPCPMSVTLLGVSDLKAAKQQIATLQAELRAAQERAETAERGKEAWRIMYKADCKPEVIGDLCVKLEAAEQRVRDLEAVGARLRDQSITVRSEGQHQCLICLSWAGVGDSIRHADWCAVPALATETPATVPSPDPSESTYAGVGPDGKCNLGPGGTLCETCASEAAEADARGAGEHGMPVAYPVCSACSHSALFHGDYGCQCQDGTCDCESYTK